MPSARYWPTSVRAPPRYGGIFDYERKSLRLNEVNAALENPKVWDDDEPAAQHSTPEPAAEVKQPPRKGPGSGGPAWIEFAKSKGVTEEFDSKDALIGALEDRGLIEKE